MLKARALVFAAACSGLSFCFGIDAALAQSAGRADTLAGDIDPSAVGKIGRVHDNLRRAAARPSLYADATDLDAEYSAFKTRTAKATGLSWAMDLSYLQQWGWSNGGSPAGQVLATPSIDWTLFRNSAIGTGSAQLAYTAVRYGTNQSAADVQGDLGLITPINDYPARQNIFAQLTYTHSLPGDKVHVSLGQYPFYNFDGNQYLTNQQHNFNNYVLAQNGSATYPIAGLGAYVQVNATSQLQFAAGFQDASNITGATLSTQGFGDYGYAWFGYAQWTPAFKGLGSSRYSITYYQVPTVPAQSRSTGWSVNAVQNLSDSWAVFGSANGASGYVTRIRSSCALGVAMNNPLQRSPTDQIGLAFGYGIASPPPTNPSGARNEKIIEAYWNWTFAKALLLTPDAQYVRDPALDPSSDSAWVLSLRATFMF
jgi:porin